MTDTIERPEQKYLDYLEDLRESGDTNMMGAAPYLVSKFPELDRPAAVKILGWWMTSGEHR